MRAPESAFLCGIKESRTRRDDGQIVLSYTALYATYLHNELGFSVTGDSTAPGMCGLGALGGVLGGWLGERSGRPGMLPCFLVLAATGFALFNIAVSATAHAALSLLFGLMVSGLLFTRLMSMLRFSAHAARIGAAVALGLGGLYTPGPFAGYRLGKLAVPVGSGPPSVFTIVLPAAIAASLLGLFDMRSMRST